MSANPETAPGATWSHGLREFWSADRDRLLHAFKTTIALVIGMGICMRLELATPRTAMVSIVIVMMHQHVGMAIARGIYRIIGMLVGGMVGLVLIARFAQAPAPFFVSLACWIGICVWGASFYRNYQSYAFVLAGYATAIVAVSAWSNPYGAFDNLLYTLSEVAAGVITASLVSAIVFPQRVGTALFALGQRHCSHFLGAFRSVFDATVSADDKDRAHFQLIGERSQIEALGSAAVFEDPELRQSAPLFSALNSHFLNATASIHAMRQVQARIARADDAAVLDLVTELNGFVSTLVPQVGPERIMTLDEIRQVRDQLAVRQTQLPLRINASLDSLSKDNEPSRQRFLTYAMALLTAAQDTGSYLDYFVDLRRPLNERRLVLPSTPRTPQFISVASRMAAMASGLRAAIAILVVAGFWYASGWEAGSTAVIGVAITAALFAIVPKPANASRQVFLGCVLGCVCAFGFSFFVLPGIEGFPQLAASIAPFILMGSYINSFPGVASVGLGFNIYFCYIGNLTNPSMYQPEALLDTGFALLTGIGVAALSFGVLVPYGSRWATTLYIRELRRMVKTDACQGRLDDTTMLRFENGVQGFILQVSDRPPRLPSELQSMHGWAFAVLDVGRSVLKLRFAEKAMGPALDQGGRQLLTQWLQAVGDLFEQVTSARYLTARDLTRLVQAHLMHASPSLPEQWQRLVAQMRSQLYAIELELLDPATPLRPAAASSP
jgi:uncharacterized membrane protein YccC